MEPDRKPGTGTDTKWRTMPDKRTTEFTLPNGGTHQARNVRSPGRIAQACDHAAKLTPMERHVLREILDLMGT